MIQAISPTFPNDHRLSFKQNQGALVQVVDDLSTPFGPRPPKTSMPKIIATNITKAEFHALQERRLEVNLDATRTERPAEMKVDVSPSEVNLDGKPSSSKTSFMGRIVALLTTASEDDESCKTPHLSLVELFKVFLWFGVRAFGGPVAQIAMMKNELVVEKKWVSVAKFNKVYAVYQVLPGPEAM